MSCNCNNNPCSCANANCACPPDYVVNPATLTCEGTTCEDTIGTNCIFLSSALTCAQVPASTDLMTTLIAMDAKICQCGSCSGTTTQPTTNYYVDSSVAVTGTGSIISPFKTLEEAYDKMVGSGTAFAPENTNITIFVFAGTGYSTTRNICINTATWYFFKGASVNFTGVGTYFIDSSSLADLTSMNIQGYLSFSTSTGGFLRNEGSYTNGRSGGGKDIRIECENISANTNGTGTPLIYHNLLYNLSLTYPIQTQIFHHCKR